MTPRKLAPPRVDTERTTTDHMTANGRHIVAGTELTVDGIRGRVRFIRHVRHVNGAEWVDVITSRGYARTVRPVVIRRVHRNRLLAV